MDCNIVENRSVFMKTDKTGLNQFCRFIKNRSITIQRIQFLKKLEKMITKKLSDKPKNRAIN
jgi:hypothetical protein